jgi:hypothetical protein
VHHIVLSGHLERADLERALQRLQQIEKTEATAAQAVAGEKVLQQNIFHQIRTDPEKAKRSLAAGDSTTSKDIDDAAAQIDRIEAELARLWEFNTQYLVAPWWQSDPATYQQQLAGLKAGMYPLLQKATLEFLEVKTRYLTTLARLRQVELETALALAKASGGRYPAKLSELVPSRFPSLPMDPYSGSDFMYASDGASYRLYSIGPDSQDDRGAVPYDPTNGTTSAGDIYQWIPAR